MYLNTTIPFISNREIIEYDMKNAGFSLIKKYKMLPNKIIKELDSIGKKSNALLPKHGKKEQDIVIGKLQRTNTELAMKLKVAFEIERTEFIKRNFLDEGDIISIKKDAFFISTTKHIDGKLDEFINFRKKNEYSSYMFLKPLEIYYKDGNPLEIKHLGEESYDLHKDHMCSFVKRILKLQETRDQQTVLTSIRRFIDKYKSRELESNYYREFNPKSKFIYLDGEISDVEYRENVYDLDISYNYEILLHILSYILR